MTTDYYTEDLTKFGHRERQMLVDILSSWNDQGLPADFDDDEVRPAFNLHSGYVFLVNSDYQVAMINHGTGQLESFYTTPYEGHEGFANELLAQYEADRGSMHPDDVEFLRDAGILDDDSTY